MKKTIYGRIDCCGSDYVIFYYLQHVTVKLLTNDFSDAIFTDSDILDHFPHSSVKIGPNPFADDFSVGSGIESARTNTSKTVLDIYFASYIALKSAKYVADPPSANKGLTRPVVQSDDVNPLLFER